MGSFKALGIEAHLGKEHTNNDFSFHLSDRRHLEDELFYAKKKEVTCK